MELPKLKSWWRLSKKYIFGLNLNLGGRPTPGLDKVGTQSPLPVPHSGALLQLPGPPFLSCRGYSSNSYLFSVSRGCGPWAPALLGQRKPWWPLHGESEHSSVKVLETWRGEQCAEDLNTYQEELQTVPSGDTVQGNPAADSCQPGQHALPEGAPQSHQGPREDMQTYHSGTVLKGEARKCTCGALKTMYLPCILANCRYG